MKRGISYSLWQFGKSEIPGTRWGIVPPQRIPNHVPGKFEKQKSPERGWEYVLPQRLPSHILGKLENMNVINMIYKVKMIGIMLKSCNMALILNGKIEQV